MRPGILTSILKQETLYAKMLEGWEKKMGEKLTPDPYTQTPDPKPRTPGHRLEIQTPKPHSVPTER